MLFDTQKNRVLGGGVNSTPQPIAWADAFSVKRTRYSKQISEHATILVHVCLCGCVCLLAPVNQMREGFSVKSKGWYNMVQQIEAGNLPGQCFFKVTFVWSYVVTLPECQLKKLRLGKERDMHVWVTYESCMHMSLLFIVLLSLYGCLCMPQIGNDKDIRGARNVLPVPIFKICGDASPT